MISNEDAFRSYIKDFQDDFNTIIAGRENAPASRIHSDAILKQWYMAKKNFIKAFNNKLIVDCGVHSFELDEVARRSKLNDFIKLIKNTYEEYDLARFLKAFQDDFFRTQKTSNTYEHTIDIKNEGLINISIPKGTKIIKAFKYFIKDSALLDFFQIKASMIVQEDKISGHLYMSVHPLDYLSVSENTNNWRSCHALDGDYCAGNLSYMCDSATIVCYLCGEDEKELPHFNGVKWNNKKWRMLLFTSEDNSLIFAGRHYPFFSFAIMDEVKRQYTYLYQTPATYSGWNHTYLDHIDVEHESPSGFSYTTTENIHNPHFMIKNYLVNPEKVIIDMCELHFNDLLHSTVYNPYYAWTSEWFPWSGKYGTVIIGATPVCPACGENMIFDKENLVCDHCEYTLESGVGPIIGSCSHCGRDIHELDEYYTCNEANDLMCKDCAESYLQVCDRCLKYYDRDILVEYIMDNGNIVHVCKDCAHELNKYLGRTEEDSNGEGSNS